MEKALILYYHKNTKKFYYVGGIDCSICKNPADNIFELYESYSTKQSFYLIRCSNCMMNPVLDVPVVSSSKFVIMVNLIPEGSQPYITTKPSFVGLRDSISLIEAAELRSIHTTDKTQLASRQESIENAQIGQDIKERISELDRPLLNKKQGLTFIDNLANAEPLIEELTTTHTTFPKIGDTKNEL